MTRVCRECGAKTAPGRRLCKHCGIEHAARQPVRTPLETVDGDRVGSWIRVRDTWHASIEFEGYEHVFACGERFTDFPADGCALDQYQIDPKTVCPECFEALAESSREKFHKPLLADGGMPEGIVIDPLVCPRGHHAVSIHATRFNCETCRRQGRETTSWDRSELIDLRKQDPPLQRDREPVTDGGITWTSLTGFQRDLLEAVARLEREGAKSYGLAIKEELEGQYPEINHGRLYPNLDTLVEYGLLEKGQLDRRTNEYLVTETGESLLIKRVERLADACEMAVATTDGGDSK